MPTTKFNTTIKALEDIQSLSPEAAIKNIDGWEKFLEAHEVDGAKKLVTDLNKLKQLLGEKPLDDGKIKTLMTKLGKETTALAGEAKAGEGDSIKKLGEALQHSL